MLTIYFRNYNKKIQTLHHPTYITPKPHSPEQLVTHSPHSEQPRHLPHYTLYMNKIDADKRPSVICPLCTEEALAILHFKSTTSKSTQNSRSLICGHTPWKWESFWLNVREQLSAHYRNGSQAPLPDGVVGSTTC